MGIETSQLGYYSILVATLNVIMTIISVRIIEKAGRKILLLGGYGVAIFFQIVLVIGLKYNYSMVSLVGLLGFIVGFAVGPGPIPWIYMSELFPLNTRSSSGILGCVTNWGTNFIVAKFFNYLVTLMAENVFVIFILASSITIAYVYKIVPVTKGRKLNDIYNDFAPRNGVDKILLGDEEEQEDLKEDYQ